MCPITKLPTVATRKAANKFSSTRSPRLVPGWPAALWKEEHPSDQVPQEVRRKLGRVVGQEPAEVERYYGMAISTGCQGHSTLPALCVLSESS